MRRLPKSELEPHYKVRVAFRNGVCLASRTEPVIERGLVSAEWIDDPNYGDTVGFIDWTQVVACTWRWHG